LYDFSCDHCSLILQKPPLDLHNSNGGIVDEISASNATSSFGDLSASSKKQEARSKKQEARNVYRVKNKTEVSLLKR